MIHLLVKHAHRVRLLGVVGQTRLMESIFGETLYAALRVMGPSFIGNLVPGDIFHGQNQCFQPKTRY
jgi:pantothenate kinase